MLITEHLKRWCNAGIITESQYNAISVIVLKHKFSVFLELNALLYLGVISLTGGLAWTAYTWFETLGDVFILSILSTLLAVSLYYCFTRPPNFFVDYVLYAGCLIMSVELAYIEMRFNVFGFWDHYLLFASAAFFGLAYRFDNRFVLSLALSSLAGWFGLRFNRFGLLNPNSIRAYALMYGGLVAGAGALLYRQHVKKHFFDTYLHVATNVVLMALLSGLGSSARSWFYLATLVLLCGICVYLGIRFRRFVFVAYGTLYGYIGCSYQLLYRTSNFTLALTYIVVSASIVILSMVLVARRFGRDE